MADTLEILEHVKEKLAEAKQSDQTQLHINEAMESVDFAINVYEEEISEHEAEKEQLKEEGGYRGNRRL